MRKITKYLLSFIILSCFIFPLTGCASFTETEESKIISSIERIVEDGVVKLVIRYENEGESASHFNVLIAYYDGGLNLSKVTYDGYKHQETLSSNLPIDLLSNYIDLPKGEGNMQQMKYLMIKIVTIVTGYQPFQFACTSNNGDLLEETFNKVPNINILIN